MSKPNNNTPKTEIFLVNNKPDDYNNCLTELVDTTAELADQYYRTKSVASEDVKVLSKYFRIVSFNEEAERTEDGRFYGAE
jgi:hypothetical protein